MFFQMLFLKKHAGLVGEPAHVHFTTWPWPGLSGTSNTGSQGQAPAVSLADSKYFTSAN
jgi:hypothetical protein